jgi:hypothetical protein
MAETKSGRDLEGETGHKGPAIARRFFSRFGIGEGVSDDDGDAE